MLYAPISPFNMTMGQKYIPLPNPITMNLSKNKSFMA